MSAPYTTVAELIERLQRFPPDAWAYAYEGEISGVVVVQPTHGDHVPLGHVITDLRRGTPED